MLSSRFLSLARGARPSRGVTLTSLALLTTTLLGPACHDTTGPNTSLVPVPSFTIVSGNAQTANAGGELPQPLVAQATTSTGTPIPGITLSFVVTQGGGHLYAGTGVTDADGNVQDYWTLGVVAGAAQTVEVRAVDPTTGVKNSYATFTATATAGPAAIIKLSAGDGQTGLTRALATIRPAALVTDAFGNPVAGVSVTFAVTAGGGSLSGSPVNTNSSGVATIGSYWRFGRAPGLNKLTATGAGLTGSPVTFTAITRFGLHLVATGTYHSCALDAANDVYCWGLNSMGQLGDGTFVERLAPVRLASSLLPYSLAAGDRHSCGLLSTGKAYCWGNNASGQLGNGTRVTSNVPVPVAGTVTFTQLAARNSTTCGLTPVGQVYCWGDNGSGQFGNGTTTSSTVPVPGGGGLTFKTLYPGCALTAAGSAYCWGYNANGQVGNGTTTNQLSPVPVSGGLTFTSVKPAANHTCGLVANGRAYCWGYNFNGELGNNCTVNAATPQLVPGSSTFTQLAAGCTAYVCSYIIGRRLLLGVQWEWRARHWHNNYFAGARTVACGRRKPLRFPQCGNQRWSHMRGPSCRRHSILLGCQQCRPTREWHRPRCFAAGGSPSAANTLAARSARDAL